MFRVAAAVAILATGAQAAAPSMEDCEALSNLAERIMEAHQKGLPMSQTMAIVTGEFERSLVIDAYGEQRWATDQNQKRSIDGFRDAVALECYRAIGQ